MNKRSLMSLILFFSAVFFTTVPANAVSTIVNKDVNAQVAVEEDDIKSEETDIINKVTFREIFKKSPEAQINSFFKKYNKYSSKNDIEKLKTMYADEYVNNDGFNKETVFKLMATASDAYKEVKYTTDILSIKTDGNYAVVKAHEIATGETAKAIKKLNDTGSIVSDIYYTDYLVKRDNKWQISATDVTYEKVDLKYGEAKKMNVDVTAPDCVPEGSEYEALVKINSPDGVFVVGSIVNEQIVFPQIEEKDVYRSIKNDELARVLSANKNKHNEYATISIAITRAQVEPPSVVLNMTGMAFVMKRINVLSVDNGLITEKEDLNEQAAKKTKKSKK
ncbi:MAG: nuclear transport factor 2 family protein [Candidatus Gastranaerophilales bacterium]|nr:nuclear transport factor 2 family protein [Candidatus Gastranaerophilales bacterium]